MPRVEFDELLESMSWLPDEELESFVLQTLPGVGSTIRALATEVLSWRRRDTRERSEELEDS